MSLFEEFLRKLLFKRCYGCEILKEQLEKKTAETQMLLDTITSICKPAIVVPSNTVSTGPVRQGRISWEAKRRQLEENRRKEHAIKLQNPEISEEIDKLEKELGLDDESRNDTPASGDDKPH